jgi:methionyl-tRNA formyltransferase
MRIIFMGTPEFAVPSLQALVAAGHDICAVYSQPPRRAGRGKSLTPSPVQRKAEELGIDVKTPVSLRDSVAQAEFASFGADLAVVAAYGLILPKAILDEPRLGCINVHGSILPRWRGAAPVQRAILAGDSETGVTIMDMDVGLDTGAMRAIERISMDGKTAGELTQDIAATGARLLIQVLSEREAYPPIPQPEEGVTYAAKIDKSEAKIDFMISAVQVERQIRAFAPSPGAFFEYLGERFRILAAETLITQSAPPGQIIDEHLTIACNPGAIRPTLIQRAGKAAMSPQELLRGFKMPIGVRLG